MASFQKIKLSGSTSGKVIPITATATPGTTIHQAVAGAVALDEIWLFVSNVTTGAATLTVEYGSVTDPGGLALKAASIPPNSYVTLVIPGLVLNGGLTVTAFSDTNGALNISGYANRIA